VREQAQILCNAPEDEEEPEEDPDPEEEEDAARLRVLFLLCALRDSYNHGGIVPVLADPEKCESCVEIEVGGGRAAEGGDGGHEAGGEPGGEDREHRLEFIRAAGPWGEAQAGP
jgi:hypothetical protein